ncbi:hypothetical protein ABZY16_20820 [Streptomyces sp. NPDC006553]|uniref:hypothetical protein n=1 Tax=Streptomyces sp. NPDC006553 TaxID=3157180 RepID=UPI0033A7CB0A
MINVCFAGVTGWTAPPQGMSCRSGRARGVSRSTACRTPAHDAPGVRRGVDSLLLLGD